MGETRPRDGRRTIDMKQFRGRCGKCKNEEEKGALYAEMMTVVREKDERGEEEERGGKRRDGHKGERRGEEEGLRR